jgi:hypothetical protein
MKPANQKGCQQERWGLFRRSPPWILVRLLSTGISLIICLSHFVLCLEGRSPRPVEKIIRVKELQSFIGINKVDENYFFNSPNQIEVLEGKIYVLDNINSQLKIFDLGGRHLKTIGKKGKGPEEFFDPDGFYLDRARQRIFIADTRGSRLQIYSFEGKLQKSIKLSFQPCKVTLIDNKVYLLAFPSGAVLDQGEPLVKIYDLYEDKIADSFHKPFKARDWVVSVLMNSMLMKKDRAGNLVIACQLGDNKIEVFNKDKKLLRQFNIIYKGEQFSPVNPDIVFKSDRDAEKIALVVSDIAFDAKNNYYFLAGYTGKDEKGELEKGREIYIYDSEGNYKATIGLPVSAKLLTLDEDDNLYVVDQSFMIRKYALIKDDKEQW